MSHYNLTPAPSYKHLGQKVCWRNTTRVLPGTEEISVGFTVPRSEQVFRLRLDVACAKNLALTLQDAITDHELITSHSDKSVG